MEPFTFLIIAGIIIAAFLFKKKPGQVLNFAAPKSRRQEEDDEAIAILGDEYKSRRQAQRVADALDIMQSGADTTAKRTAK